MTGFALEIVAVALAIGGAACGIVAARRPTIRVWTVHLLAAAAMVWMVLPTAAGAAVGRHVWAAALLAVMLWTVAAHVGGHRDDHGRVAAVREIADLVATAVLVVLLPASHHMPVAVTPHGHASGAAIIPFATSIFVVIGWAVIVVACSIVSYRRLPSRRAAALGTSSGGLMVAGMAVMTGMAATA